MHVFQHLCHAWRHFWKLYSENPFSAVFPVWFWILIWHSHLFGLRDIVFSHWRVWHFVSGSCWMTQVSLPVPVFFYGRLGFSNSLAERSKYISFPLHFCSSLRFNSTILTQTFLIFSSFSLFWTVVQSLLIISVTFPTCGSVLDVVGWPYLLAFVMSFSSIMKLLNPHRTLCSMYWFVFINLLYHFVNVSGIFLQSHQIFNVF